MIIWDVVFPTLDCRVNPLGCPAVTMPTTLHYRQLVLLSVDSHLTDCSLKVRKAGIWPQKHLSVVIAHK